MIGAEQSQGACRLLEWQEIGVCRSWQSGDLEDAGSTEGEPIFASEIAADDIFGHVKDLRGSGAFHWDAHATHSEVDERARLTRIDNGNCKLNNRWLGSEFRIREVLRDSYTGAYCWFINSSERQFLCFGDKKPEFRLLVLYKGWEIDHTDSLLVSTSGHLLERVDCTVQIVLADCVGHGHGVLHSSVLRDLAPIDLDHEVVLRKHLCVSCGSVVVRNLDLCADGHFILADDTQVRILLNSEVLCSLVVGHEIRQAY